VLAVAVAALAASAVAASPAAAATLRERLDRALEVPGISRAQTGAYVFDLQTGRQLFARNRSRSYAPASNQKLGVALAALERLGPRYRIPTEVIPKGMLSGATLDGKLALKGYGDPSLSFRDLRRLASAVRAQGIRRVTGKIVGDERYFDKLRVGRGWRPSWYKIESPPLSALVVSRAKVNGRTVDRPALAAAQAFRSALVAAGVRVQGGAAVGRAPRAGAPIAAVRSGTMKKLVRKMNKMSDNFYAEMLVKHLGARLRGEGSTQAGCVLVRRVLKKRGVPLSGVRIVDGSGLSLEDRFTTRALGAMLVSAWNDPAVRTPFFRSLPVAGVDGTLEDRMRRAPARGHVYAKTGTTNVASSLSGYVGSRYVFSVIQNDSPINWTRARQGQDRFARVLASTL
jgi:D-alanyl-D-alanine carboxypeptidase/D-alanyl-D-alanine-endopeptidase (penicillin-binding protein 4)